MERLTDRKTAADLVSNYAGLRAAGQPRDIGAERYIKLAAFEDQEENQMTPEQKDKCKKIIDHYGIAKQRRQLVEECAELIQAISKLERAGESGDGGAIYVAECGLREEIADVTIMLEQIKSTPLLGSKKNFNGLIEYKLNRQLDRIAGEATE